MSTALERIATPEDRELTRYLESVAAKKLQAAEFQTELESLREALAQFNAEYHARVGTWLADAHRFDREAAEYQLKTRLRQQQPSLSERAIQEQIRREFRQQREQHEQEAEQARRFSNQDRQFREAPQLNADEDLRRKELLRELSKRFHPDLANSADEVAERTRRMQAITDAFHRRDLQELERLSHSADVDTSVFERLSTAEKLVWAIREIARLDQLLQTFAEDQGNLRQTSMYRLWNENRQSTDLLTRLEREAKQKQVIAAAKLRQAKLDYERAA